MKKRLMNRSEELTYGALVSVCELTGAHVFPKVRLADVLPLNGSGISDDHFSFGLRSHFDFVVTDDSYRPLFSVEFDGPYHLRNASQKHRDRLKNDLCEQFGHSLLRINSRYLSRDYRGLDLLTYFVEAWFLLEAFSAAQENGTVPYDEPFDMTFIYSLGSRKTKWPYWLSFDVQKALRDLHSKGQIGQMAPSHYIGTDSSGNYRCMSWVVFDPTRVVSIKTGMTAQRFPAVCEGELVGMLAIFDLHDALRAAISGANARNLCDRNAFFSRRLPEFQERYRMASRGSVGATI